MDWAKFNKADQTAKAFRGIQKALKDASTTRLGLASMAAAVIAPTIIDNDERGYVKSSFITTPVIAAAYMAAPGITSIFKQEIPQYANLLKDAPNRIKSVTPITYGGLKTMREEFGKGNIKRSVLNRAVGEFFAGGTKASTLDASIQQLQGHLPNLLTQAANTRYLENVVHAEALRTMSNAELIAYNRQLKGSLAAPKIGMGGVQEMIERQIANRNEPFIKAMNFHAQKMSKMNYSGFSSVAETAEDAVGRVNMIDYEDFYGKLGKDFKNQRPQLFQEIDQQIKLGTFKANDVKIVASRNAAVNPIVGIQIGDLNIPVPDSSGRIVGGKNWDKAGVSRGIFTEQGKYSSDVFAVKHYGVGIDKIKGDLARANIINGVDETEDFSMFTPRDFESVSGGSNLADKIRSMDYVASDATGFGKDGTTGFNYLNAHETENVLGRLDSFGLVKSGSEKMSGVFQDEQMRKMSYYGLQDPSRQNALTRSLSKNLALETDGSKPVWAIPDFLEELSGGEKLPLMGITEGAVSPAQKTFFSSLPSTVELLHEHQVTAVQQLMFKHSLSETQANKAWSELSNWLSNPDNLATMRKSTTLGEGSKLMSSKMSNMKMSRLHNFEVHEHALGADAKRLIGSRLDNNTVLGFNAGNPIMAEGQDNYLENITNLEDGKYSISIREKFNVGTGAKIDLVEGTRGLISGEVDSDIYSKGLSLYNQLTGSGPAIAPTEIFGLFGSEAGKGNAISQNISLASSALRKLNDMGQEDLAMKYEEALFDRGISGTKTRIFDSAQFSMLGDKRGVEEFKKTQAIIADLLRETGDRIRVLAIKSPEVLTGTGRRYAATGSSMSFGEFLLQSEAPMTASFWDHTAINAPKEVRITNDIKQQLNLSGDFGILKEINSRVAYDGDPTMARNVAEYLQGDSSAITQRMSMREAFNGRAKNIKLSSPEGRAGSMFDIDHPIAKSNFIMDLPNGESIPVPGHDAFGGRSNRYDGKFSATDIERNLKGIGEAFDKNEGIEEAISAYNKSLEPVLFGKKSMLRAPGTDSSAFGGFMQHRDATMLMPDGGTNPFEVRVSSKFAARQNKAMADALAKGEAFPGIVTRYPVSAAPKVMFTLDKTLAENEIGMDARLASILHGDYDKDPAYLFPLYSENAAAEVKAAVSAGSQQHKDMEEFFRQQVETHKELPQNGGVDADSLSTRTEKLLNKALNRNQINKERLVSTTIGEYSNTQTAMLSMLENHGTLTDPNEIGKLKSLFFDTVYQSPIAATKNKAGSSLGLESARMFNTKLEESLQSGASFNEFYSAFSNVGQFAPDSVRETISNSKDLLERFHSGRNPDMLRVAKAQTASLRGPRAAADLEASLLTADVVKYSGAAKLASQETSTGARMAAEAIGASNEGLATAKRIAKAFESSGAKKAIGVGLGIAAIAGLMTSTISSPRSKSSNAYRPEETAAGQDAIPGEGVEGTMSSTPPRTMVSSKQANVTQAMVAPIHQSSDIEVNLKSDDQSRATRAARLIAQSAGGGSTTVTNNYKTSDRQSLRNQQKLRDRLQES